MRTGFIRTIAAASGVLALLVVVAEPAAATHSVTSVAPNELGQNAGAQVLTIIGSGFSSLGGGPTVVVSGTGVTVTNTALVSSTQITATVNVAASASLGPHDVTVRQGIGGLDNSACTGCLTINPQPTITTVSPSARGRGAPPVNVTITGTGYVGTPAVAFSGPGITINTITRNSATQLTVNVAVGPNAPTGARDVTVTNPDRGTVTLPGGFTVNPAPTVASASPSQLSQGSTGAVTITGTGYGADPAVVVSGSGVTVNSVTRDSATQLTVTLTVAQNAALGARDVMVTNPDGGAGTGSGVIAVTAAPSAHLTGWASLHLGIRGSPALASTASNTARIFVRGVDDAIWTRTFLNGWGPWSSLGGGTLAGPGASARGSAIDVFIRGGDNAVWQNTCQETCTGWSSLGGLTTAGPASVSRTGSRIDLFIRGVDNQLWHRAFNAGVWGEWESLGGALTSAPTVTSTGAGLLDVAARGTDGAVWTRGFNGAWGPWIRVGGQIVDQPAIVARPGGFVDVYARGPDNALWYSQRLSGTWRGFQPLGGVLTSGPAASIYATSPGNQQLVAVRGGDGQVWVNLAVFS